VEANSITALSSQIIWLAFGLGVIFGAVARRTHFCTMGAVADIFAMGDWDRMRLWLLAIAVALIGTSTLAYFGVIDVTKSIYTAPRLLWLSHLIGGALFGFGMVLASGCGNKTLVRIGGGNLKSLMVFVIVGLSAFMSLKGILAIPRSQWFDSIYLTLPSTQDLPALAAHALGSTAPLPLLRLLITALVSAPLIAFALASRSFRSVENLLAALIIGGVIVAAWYVSGKLGYLAENPNTLEESFLTTNSGKMEAFSFVAPFAYTLNLLMMWTDQSQALSFGVAASLGVVVGSFIHALVSRSFRWESFNGVSDTANHIIGAAMMGFGGITALGCTIGQGISGISTLALGSFITFSAIIVGAVIALKTQTLRLAHTT
jgi:uncharacterized membrane protein YedE/YeeE